LSSSQVVVRPCTAPHFPAPYQMEGGRVRHEAAARAARLACAEGPPVGGTFQFQIFIQTPSPEIWSETISGSEAVLARKWGSLFLAYLL